MSDGTSKERPQFVPAVRKPKLPYLCAGAECVTCKRPVSGDWGLVPDECETCDAERQARYYRSVAQWAEEEVSRLKAMLAARTPQEATGLQCEKDGVCALVSRNDDEWHCTACNGDFVRKQPVEPSGWQPIETAPKGRNVLVAYQNKLGKWRMVRACYYEAGTLMTDDSVEEPYCDEDGYAHPGWYEECESQEYINRTDEEPVLWHPLPALPPTKEGTP